MQSFSTPWGIIQPGQIWAITGESDSGHSAMLAHLETTGRELVSFKHHFRNLSNTTDFYYQQRFNSADSEDAPTVNEYLSAILHRTGSITDEAGTISGQTGIWTKEKLISRLNLAALLDEQLIKLSNGETKRVLIAAALINKPSVLLLDHPLTGLDVATRADLSLFLQEIASSGIFVILATGPLEIPDSVTHIAVMQKDRAVQTMEKKDFFPEKFGFLHDTPINLNTLQALLSTGQQPKFQTIVEMKNVTIRYQQRVILDKINWKISQGERWSLSGPNGAGKSTLLSLINGDNPQAYANYIILFDRKRGSGESIWDIKRNTGFVSPELYQYFPMEASCLQVIESGFYDTVGLFRPSQTDKAQLGYNWMQLMSIEANAGKLFSRVSPTVQRLCLLARALVKNPPLLILDEPTQGLDLSQQQFFTRLIDAICGQSNVTLIYVSHFKEHIPLAVNHSLQLEKGRVIVNK